MKHFDTQSPEATVTRAFVWKRDVFKMRRFERTIEKSIAMNKTKGKISIQDRKYGLKEASHPA